MTKPVVNMVSKGNVILIERDTESLLLDLDIDTGRDYLPENFFFSASSFCCIRLGYKRNGKAL